MASLRLELALSGASVEVRGDPADAAEVIRLGRRFRSAEFKAPTTIEVELDDLLEHVAELAATPPFDLEWGPRLKALVEESLSDAAFAEASLVKPSSDVWTADRAVGALGADWGAPLTSFQRRDISRLLTLRHGANFSVPGAGKTRVALAVYAAARHGGEVSRLLVVAPKSAFEAWLTESAQAFRSGPLSAVILDGSRAPAEEELVLVNYERLVQAQSTLTELLLRNPAMLILDEAHRMKLGLAGVYGAVCLALGPMAKRRLILTGTPAPNGVDDLKSLMAFVWPGRGRQVVSRAVGGGDLRRASSVLRPLFTRTTKRELHLPPVETRLRRLALPTLHREIYRALTGELSARARTTEPTLEAWGRSVMYLLMAADSPALLALGTTRYEPLSFRVPPLTVPTDAPLRRLMEDLPSYELSPKFQEVIAIVANNARLGRKTLVWSTFVRSLTTLGSMLRGFHPALVHGGVDDRESELERFRTDPECFVLLSNPATLGEGISLHHVCHDAVFVDRDFAAGRYLQSLDRIHRLGLSPSARTRVTVLVASETIDEVVDLRLAAKLAFMSAVLDDPDIEALGDLDEEPSIGGGLGQEDLLAILAHLNAAPS